MKTRGTSKCCESSSSWFLLFHSTEADRASPELGVSPAFRERLGSGACWECQFRPRANRVTRGGVSDSDGVVGSTP